MKFAVLSPDTRFVDNIIITAPDRQSELEASLGRTLMDASPLGLTIGDYYNGTAWTRNVDGEQVALPLGDNADVAEAIAILDGEVDE